ncbi:MAG: DUF4177 domain-containing protein [Chloroflexi bacterium]|nr:DUF4177 domain-containing protein [Chloroflexota bacterium]
MTDTMIWEYRVQTWGSIWKSNKDENLEALLNEWGEEGWEVISTQHGANSEKVKIIAKRPLTHSRHRERSYPS